MKVRKGFTLIELLAVIVILAIIALIAAPIVMGLIENAHKGAAKSSALIYIDEVERSNMVSMLSGNKITGVYSISYFSDKIKIDGSVPTKGGLKIDSNGEISVASLCVNNYKVVYDENASSIAETNCDDMEYGDITYDSMLYKESILNGTYPRLGENMIPVTIANDGAVKYADVFSPWYNYTNKEWANAIKLLDDSKISMYKVGDIIPENQIESYFVWIPRYKYKIFNTGNYSTQPSIRPGTTTSNVRTIEIVFENKDTTPSTGTTVGSYLTHPAFTSFDTNGIWVGKYQTGNKTATSEATGRLSSTDPDKIVVKPGAYGWRNNRLYNVFVAAYNYDRNNDSHMLKNTEWGAVAYLTSSLYGRCNTDGCTEVSINNSPSYITGSSAGRPGDTTTSSSTVYAYNTAQGYLASTTGNITGIYDMSGISWEFMASNVSGNFGNSGFTTTNRADYGNQYFDTYPTTSAETKYNNRILGDATGELGPFYANDSSYSRYLSFWYEDYARFPSPSYPWFVRGGQYQDGINSGIFYFQMTDGTALYYYGSRIALLY